MIIEIPYTPRYSSVHREIERHRFSVIVAHRRFGKTVLCVNHLIKSALLSQKNLPNFAYIAPQRNQAKDVSWKYLLQYTEVFGKQRRVNLAELSIVLPGQRTIRIYGADNPDSLRGNYFDGVVLDEVGQMKPEVWSQILQPALSDRQGWACFIGTPKGINLFSELYYAALQRQAAGDPDWLALSFPVTATTAIDEREVERLRIEMPEVEFRQEYLCDFTASSENTLIPIDDVMAAIERTIDYETQRAFPRVLGVDVSRFGDDASVFFLRQGKFTWQPKVLRGLSNVDLTHELVLYVHEWHPQYVFIDQGQGTGVIDLARSLLERHKVEIIEVPFGSKARAPDRYINRRAEMWTEIREWLRDGGSLPDNALLLQELTAPTYSFDVSGRIKLEEKEKIKERLKRSTDVADALALTFATALPADTETFIPELDAYGRNVGFRLRSEILQLEKKDNAREHIFDW